MSGGVVRPTQSPEKTVMGRPPSSLRDRIDLRVQMQDEVYEFARMRRQELFDELRAKDQDADDASLWAQVDKLQPAYEEFDPVVAMALVGADHRNDVDVRLAANARVAEYVRPKLKSVEVRVTENDPEQIARRAELMGRLRDFLDAGAGAKRTIDVTPRPSPPAPSAQDEELERPEEGHDAGAAPDGAED